jgi:nucleotide-binding universal stress UspA family protein
MYNKILVPLDGSQLAECSLAHVKAVATGCGVAEVVLLTVTQDIIPSLMPWTSSQEQVNNTIAETNKNLEMVHKKASEYLQKVGEDLKHSGLTVQMEVIEAIGHRDPAELILDYAEKNKVDLIVIATHGRSGITRWAFGSEAENIVRHSKIPVLTITPAGCRIR